VKPTRNRASTVSASQPASFPSCTLPTHEVVVKRAGCTLIIPCYSEAGAESVARWQRSDGVEAEVVEVNP
jgi:hypothetical protein